MFRPNKKQMLRMVGVKKMKSGGYDLLYLNECDGLKIDG